MLVEGGEVKGCCKYSNQTFQTKEGVLTFLRNILKNYYEILVD